MKYLIYAIAIFALVLFFLREEPKVISTPFEVSKTYERIVDEVPDQIIDPAHPNPKG